MGITTREESGGWNNLEPSNAALNKQSPQIWTDCQKASNAAINKQSPHRFDKFEQIAKRSILPRLQFTDLIEQPQNWEFQSSEFKEQVQLKNQLKGTEFTCSESSSLDWIKL